MRRTNRVILRGRRPGQGVAGYTMLELLIGSTITSMVAMMFYSSTYNLAPRLDLRGVADQATFLIMTARLEAIQRGVTTVVEA
ncbi:MAG: hypothetical protein GY953_09145, partial [bacterium]|nr:hypothetical protein [bacterium]